MKDRDGAGVAVFESKDFYKTENLKVFWDKSVVRVNSKAKEVILEDSSTISFNKALIATGSRPWRHNILSIEKAYYLRSLNDADRIKAAASRVRSTVIISASFISVKVSSSLTSLGIKTTIVEIMPYI